MKLPPRATSFITTLSNLMKACWNHGMTNLSLENTIAVAQLSLMACTLRVRTAVQIINEIDEYQPNCREPHLSQHYETAGGPGQPLVARTLITCSERASQRQSSKRHVSRAARTCSVLRSKLSCVERNLGPASACGSPPDSGRCRLPDRSSGRG